MLLLYQTSYYLVTMPAWEDPGLGSPVRRLVRRGESLLSLHGYKLSPLPFFRLPVSLLHFLKRVSRAALIRVGFMQQSLVRGLDNVPVGTLRDLQHIPPLPPGLLRDDDRLWELLKTTQRGLYYLCATPAFQASERFQAFFDGSHVFPERAKAVDGHNVAAAVVVEVHRNAGILRCLPGEQLAARSQAHIACDADVRGPEQVQLVIDTVCRLVEGGFKDRMPWVFCPWPSSWPY
jgi:hypothetical protein